jgi:hypothetical protein
MVSDKKILRELAQRLIQKTQAKITVYKQLYNDLSGHH